MIFLSPALPPSPRFSYSDETAAEKRNEESGTCSMKGVDVQAGIDLCTAAPALAASAERQECQHHTHTLPISLPLSSPSTGPGKAGFLGVLHVHGFESSCFDQPTKSKPLPPIFLLLTIPLFPADFLPALLPPLTQFVLTLAVTADHDWSHWTTLSTLRN